MAIIRGTEGGGKGYFWKILSNYYFSELGKQFDRIDRMVETMQGCLINEMGEMAGLNARTSEDAKEFITRTHDKIRLAYAHRPDTYPRQGILTGTSNRNEVLYDPTGNRRFWLWFDTHDEDNPIDLERLRRERPMLWGEAVDEYKAWRERQPHGELRLDLTTKEQRDIRDRLSESVRARTVYEEIADVIEDWMTRAHDPMGLPLDDTTFCPSNHGYEEADPGDRVIPAMVCAEMVYLALYRSPLTSAYKNADTRTYGKALKVLEKRGRLTPVGGDSGRARNRRHNHRDTWYYRPEFGDGPLWIDAPDDEDLDALL